MSFRNPVICFFKCGLNPELELSREFRSKMRKTQSSLRETKSTRNVTIGSTRTTRVSAEECIWDGTILLKTPEDVDEDTLSNSVLPVHPYSYSYS